MTGGAPAGTADVLAARSDSVSRPDRVSGRERLGRYGPPALSWVLGLGLWEVLGRTSDPYIFASFTESMAALWDLLTSGILMEHLAVTMTELGIGFAIAGLFGIVGGVLAGLNAVFRGMTTQWVTVFLATPFPAVFPIFVVWFGLGMESKIALAIFAGFVPVWLNTRAGIASVSHELVEMTKAFGGRWRHVVGSVLLPGSLPSVMEGVRLGLGRAFIAVIVGELLAARQGLGFLISLSGQTLRMDQLLATVAVVAAITLALSGIMNRIQSLLVVRWWEVKDE